MKHSRRPNPALPLMLLLLLLFVLSQTGCAHNSNQPDPVSPKLPTIPSGLTPQPSVPYLESVKENMKRWAEMLRATPLIPSPSK